MTIEDIRNKFEELRSTSENETVEFKEAKDNFDFNALGKYFSALSNEANLQGVRCGWLVFGVHDKTRGVVGTSYRNDPKKLQSLKHEIAQKTTGNLTFSNVFELEVESKRVLLFEIPAAPQGVPIAFDGHFYGRDGESLVALNLQEIETIRNQSSFDWSAQVAEGATTDDLDGEALNKARFEFKKKNPDIADEINQWSDATFLNKARLTVNGKITNAALILLGTPESAVRLMPAIAQMTWILKDESGIEVDYKHFYPPFLMSVDKLLSQIRNITFRYLPDNTLFPDEVMKYDNYVIREALHNCIAHQDYSLRERINVVETPDSLLFSNGGAFIPKTIENVIEKDAPQRYYRNTFLCTAMVNLNMIDTIGSGIKRMFVCQRKRLFPLPDYTITEKEVSVTIYGKVINEKYVKLLKEDENLTLAHIIALDKVQKQQPIDAEMAKLLKSRKLIDGRKGNYFLSETASAQVGEMVEYVQNKAFNKKYYIDLSYELIKKQNAKGTTRSEIDSLIIPKLSKILNDDQKRNFVRNMLHQMVVDEMIISKRRRYYLKDN
ncbi:MAG: putative DNA binding domain-containing protein [Bacteroidales bacterium]|nr:putative DNA binding domain-containing protein [Bacteroidales bacterium]